ncbi:AMP-binding protein, partial [Mycobacterium sp. ITM-2017-0098]
MSSAPITVADVLRRRRGLADKPLLVCDRERLSYADADARSAVLARRLVALGAGKGTHVGLLYPNGAQFVVAMLAAARIGAVVVPFSTFGTAPELRRQLIHADIAVLLAAGSYRTNDYVERLSEAVGKTLTDRATIPILTADVPVLRHIVFDA